MPRKPLIKPRKHASQDRSRVTVDALVEATARILVKDGYDKASTNRIAAEAGVSIGSLYQYFPSKESLVAAVVERHSEEIAQVARPVLAQVASQPIEKAVRRLVTVAIKAHCLDPKLHRVLAEQIPRTGRADGAELFLREAHEFFTAYLEAHKTELRPADLRLASFMCVTAIEALAHTAVLHTPEMLSDEALQQLAAETTRLIVGYLQ